MRGFFLYFSVITIELLCESIRRVFVACAIYVDARISYSAIQRTASAVFININSETLLGDPST